MTNKIPNPKDRKWRELTIAIVSFFVISALFHWSSLRSPATALGSLSDDVANAWSLGWAAEVVIQGGQSLWQAPFYAPYLFSLAYSEYLPGPGILMAPLTLASGSPIISMNLLIWLASAFMGFTTYMLIRAYGGDKAGAYLGGIIAAFAAPRLRHAPGHFHLLTFGWIPLSLLALHRYHETGKRKWLVLLGAAVIGQGLFSLHGFVFLLAALATAVCVYGWRRQHGLAWTGTVALAVAFSFVALSPLLIPYTTLASVNTFSPRSQAVRQAFSAPLIDFFAPSAFMSQNTISPGFVPLTLFALGMAWYCRAYHHMKEWPRSLVAALVIMAVGTIFALGPEMRVVRDGPSLAGPFTMLQQLPGFSGIRAVERFAQLTLLGLALAVGLTWQYFTHRLGRWRWHATWVTIAFLAAELFATAPRAQAYAPELFAQRPVDHWLLSRPSGCMVAELPLNDIRTPDEESALFMYYTRYHGKRIVNGYGGYFPPRYIELERQVYGREAGRALPTLRALGADFIIVHPSMYPPPTAQAALDAFDHSIEVENVTSFPDSVVYQVRRSECDRW